MSELHNELRANSAVGVSCSDERRMPPDASTAGSDKVLGGKLLYGNFGLVRVNRTDCSRGSYTFKPTTKPSAIWAGSAPRLSKNCKLS